MVSLRDTQITVSCQELVTAGCRLPTAGRPGRPGSRGWAGCGGAAQRKKWQQAHVGRKIEYESEVAGSVREMLLRGDASFKQAVPLKYVHDGLHELWELGYDGYNLDDIKKKVAEADAQKCSADA